MLGAWGCGVFRNEPATIAGIFMRVLVELIFRGLFRQSTFAVYNSAPQPATFAAFHQQFGA